MALLKGNKNLHKKGFMRSALTLIGGTALAQALTVLALPILTRIYTPNDFSIFAIYIALLSMSQVVVCLRLEIAIPLPKQDFEAANLLVLSIFSAIMLSMLVALLVWLFGDWFFFVINQPLMEPFGWLLPLGMLLAGIYAGTQFWSTRKKRFETIAKTRLIQVGIGLTVQLSLGLMTTGAMGLLLGHALISGAGTTMLAHQLWRIDNSFFKGISITSLLQTLSKHRKFPLYSTWEGLATNASLQLPVLIISAFAFGPEVGFLMLATRIIGAPVQLVGNAVGQVYLSSAAEYWRQGTLYKTSKTVTRNLFLFVSLPMLVIIIICAPFFGTFFGAEWSQAGVIALWLAPMFAIRTVSSPISMVMNVVGKQRQMLQLKVLGLFVRVGATYIGAIYGGVGIEAYGVSSAIVYLLYFFVFISASKEPYSNFSRSLES